MSKIELHNVDCMEYMRTLPDKAFDLAIVDPPYGIGANKMTLGNGRTRVYRGASDWDAAIPNEDYFTELRRVSINQIVWGGNYMTERLKPSMGWVFWDKGTGSNDFADGELAWTSFDSAMKKVFISWVGANAKDGLSRIHPTQKPVALYRWLLKNYAKPGQRILDTHGGSMSIAIACDIEGYDLTLCEIDKDYFEAGKKRLEQHRAQPRMFDAPKPPHPEQLTIDPAA